MSSLAMTHLDLESGGSDEEEEGSVCFSEGSCYSQFYSTADGSNDDYTFDHEIGQVLDSRRVSSVDDKNGIVQVMMHLERDCRICQLSLDMDATHQENGIPIELGCSCKHDLAAAHKHCAEAWFKIKGNKICEICNSVARNVVGPDDIESGQQANEVNAMAANAASATAPFSSTTQTRACLNGHRFLNFLLACMVFAFVISWLFHFNIPS